MTQVDWPAVAVVSSALCIFLIWLLVLSRREVDARQQSIYVRDHDIENLKFHKTSYDNLEKEYKVLKEDFDIVTQNLRIEKFNLNFQLERDVEVDDEYPFIITNWTDNELENDNVCFKNVDEAIMFAEGIISAMCLQK